MLFKDLSRETILSEIARERFSLKDQHDEIREKEKDFYEDRGGQNKYLDNWGFKKDNGQTDLPLYTVNLTKKIIDKISLTYKYQPDRFTVDLEEEQDDNIRDWYATADEFSLGFKYAERYKNLLGNVLLRPYFNPANRTWYPFVETIYEAHFLEDDPLHPVAFSYPRKQELTSVNAKDDWWIFWSDTENFEYIPGTNKYRENEFGGVNQFGIVPMVEIRDSYPVDQYQTVGAYALVGANQNINIAMNDLNYMIHFQAFDQVVGSGIQKDDAGAIKLGTNKIVLMPQPDSALSLLGYSPKITECIEAIKFQMQAIGYTYNLNINWSVEGNPASGFALLVQNIDLLEARQDDVELAMMYEKKMYKVLVGMQSWYSKYKMLDKEEPILPDAKIGVDFTEISFPINQAEEIERLKFELEIGIITAVDIMQSKNPDMDREQAEQKYKENKRINGKLTARDLLGERIEEAGGEIVPES